MKKHFRIPFSFLLLFYSSCTFGQIQKATEHLKTANSLLYQNPDSAYIFATKAKDAAINAGNDTLIARADQVLGVVEGMKGHYSTSLKYFLPALDVYERYGLTKRQSSVLSNVARVILAQQRYRESILYLKRALELDKRHADQFGVVSDYMNLGIVYRQLGVIDSALYFYKHAEENAGTLQDEMAGTLRANIGYNLCFVYTAKGNYAEARTKLNEVLAYYKNKHDQTGLLLGKWYEANLELRTGSYDKAIALAKDALAESKSLQMDDITINVLKVLTEVYELKHQHEQALVYYKEYKVYSDSVYNSQKARTVAELQYAYESEKKDKAIQLLKKEEERQRFILIIVSIGALAAIFLLVVIALSKKVQALRHRQREFELTAAREKAEYEKYQVEAEKRMEEEKNKQLQLELESSQRELATNTLFIHQKNKVLEDVQNELQKLTEQSDSQQKQQFVAISKNVQSHMNFENDWNNIIMHFERVHPHFFNKLKGVCPDLTANELKQAAYIRINLNSKEVANLMNVDTASVKMSRYRIKKKLQLSGDDSLTEFIMSI